MPPFVRAHYPDAENRIRVEVQWASPDLLKIAHDATSYAGVVPVANFWFGRDSDDLIAFLEVFPPNEIRPHPIIEAAKLNGVEAVGSNDELISRLKKQWHNASGFDLMV